MLIYTIYSKCWKVFPIFSSSCLPWTNAVCSGYQPLDISPATLSGPLDLGREYARYRQTHQRHHHWHQQYYAISPEAGFRDYNSQIINWRHILYWQFFRNKKHQKTSRLSSSVKPHKNKRQADGSETSTNHFKSWYSMIIDHDDDDTIMMIIMIQTEANSWIAEAAFILFSLDLVSPLSFLWIWIWFVFSPLMFDAAGFGEIVNNHKKCSFLFPNSLKTTFTTLSSSSPIIISMTTIAPNTYIDCRRHDHIHHLQHSMQPLCRHGTLTQIYGAASQGPLRCELRSPAPRVEVPCGAASRGPWGRN